MQERRAASFISILHSVNKVRLWHFISQYYKGVGARGKDKIVRVLLKEMKNGLNRILLNTQSFLLHNRIENQKLIINQITKFFFSTLISTCLQIDEKLYISPQARFKSLGFCFRFFLVIPSAAIIFRAEDINTTVPKTIIHWNSQSTIEKVSCEMRYKATTNQTWNVS